MKAYLYYTVHSFKNAIKKLLGTWLRGLIAVIVVVFVIFMIAEPLLTLFDENNVTDEPTSEEELVVAANDTKTKQIIELAVCGIIVFILAVDVVTGDKSGAAIFNMADINFLFPSPRKPQSILMFKVFLQFGTVLVGSVYLLFQLPNLIINVGLSVKDALIIFAAWLLLLILGKTITVLVYLLAASHERIKKLLRPTVYICIGFTLILYLITAYIEKLNYYDAAVKLFASEGGRYFPVIGWLRGFVMFAIEGNATASLLCFSGVIVFIIILLFIINSIKVDIYEDALLHASVLFDQNVANTEGRKMPKGRKPTKKHRPDEIGHGEGASIFFFKAFHQRRYGAKLGFFTGAMITNLVLTISIALITRFAFKSTDNFVPVGIALLIIMFFVCLGNPISEDTSRPFISLIPESAFLKLIYSMLAGLAGDALNLLLPCVISAVILKCNIFVSIAWYLLVVSFGTFVSSAGLLCDMLLPMKIPPVTRRFFQYIIVSLSVLPTEVLIIVGYVLSVPAVFLFISMSANFLLSMLFILISSSFLHSGRQ